MLKQQGLRFIARVISRGLSVFRIFIFLAQAVFAFLKCPTESDEDKGVISTIDLERWVNDGGKN